MLFRYETGARGSPLFLGFVYTNPMLDKLLPFEPGDVEILGYVSDHVERAKRKTAQKPRGSCPVIS